MKNGLFIIIVILFFLSIFRRSFYKESLNDMKQYNVIFGGAARDVSKNIESILKRIDICGKKFNSYQLIIYENDSKDGTRDILLKNKKENYHYIFEDNVEEPRRTKRLEHGRNLVLNKARELNRNNYYQYLIIIDLDHVNDTDTFTDTFQTNFNRDDWDVVTANQAFYYDLWALRNKDLNHDCIHESTKCLDLGGKIKFEGKQFIEVDSAFGGVGIYKLSSIPDTCKYVGEYQDGKEKCEHVEFNECIKKNGGKIFINPEFINGPW